jgi:hypothetical protein
MLSAMVLICVSSLGGSAMVARGRDVGVCSDSGKIKDGAPGFWEVDGDDELARGIRDSRSVHSRERG